MYNTTWPHLFWKIFVAFLTSTLLRTQNTTLLSKVLRRFFSNFVAFSENPKFNFYLLWSSTSVLMWDMPLIWFLRLSASSLRFSLRAISFSTWSSHLFKLSRFSPAWRNFSWTACCYDKKAEINFTSWHFVKNHAICSCDILI